LGLHIFKRRNKWRLFGQLAVENGLNTQEAIERALAIQNFEADKKMHRKIGVILFEKGILTMENINAVLREQRMAFPWWAWIYSILYR